MGRVMIKQPQKRTGETQSTTEQAAVMKTAISGRLGGEKPAGNADGFTTGDRVCCGGMQLGKFVGKLQILNSWLS